MAFESVRGRKVFSSLTGITYIFGDYFVVMHGETAPPEIYEWSQVSSVTETLTMLTITAKGNTYNIEMGAFESDDKFLAVRTIIEGQIAVYPEIRYKFNKRILPLKYLYKNITPNNAYIMKGYYDEKVINSCNIALVIARFGRYMFLMTVLLIAVLFFISVAALGGLRENWLYCLPLSIFLGIIISIVLYLVVGIIARHKFNSTKKYDPATSKEITVVVSTEGFAAVESSVYTGKDLIPWGEANFFIETHAGLVVLRDNKSVFWLPKSFMPKNQQSDIFALIASRVRQR